MVFLRSMSFSKCHYAQCHYIRCRGAKKSSALRKKGEKLFLDEDMDIQWLCGFWSKTFSPTDI
jgi:hypothetical protein